jgi:cytochrome b561
MNTQALPATRYSRGAIAFHWLIALLIVLNFAAALVAESFPKPVEQQIMGNHMAIGMAILALSVLRLLWRLTHPAPAFAPRLKTWEAGLARVVHTLFYVLMIGIPLAGWIMTSAFSGGRAVSFLGLFDIPGLPLAKSEAVAGLFHEVHELGAWMMLALFVLHVAGALKHQFLDRDGTLARMLPGGGPRA